MNKPLPSAGHLHLMAMSYEASASGTRQDESDACFCDEKADGSIKKWWI